MLSVFKHSCLVALLVACVPFSGQVLAGGASDDQKQPRVTKVNSKVVVGWIEKGLILPEHTTVKIKVDSGALTSSMHAVNIDFFEHKGKSWVRYDVPVKDADTGKRVTMKFERPVYRRILVRGAGGEDRRPVVKMSMCIGGQIYEEQFSLRDRGDMTYPVLIGRRTIEHIGLIDVSRTFMVKLDCPSTAEDDERDKQKRMRDDESMVDDTEVASPEQVEEEYEE
jgi:hypothetical protein